ncbi:MAG: helix-turn-helix transcriptional regulator [Clostridia bacterium]|nr:helix-turn-helix transcriptional regulator [Clostridia bacterium]
MNIGTNIYTLRKEKKITQAQLAEKLGVSEQSVSKWENNQCAPDVSLFPVIAEYFGVSIDRIFGYHRNSYADDVKAIIKAADDSMDTYKEIEIISEGLKKYPNSPDLKIYLSFSLSMVNRISEDENERNEAVTKAIRLCTEVIDTCGDNKQVDSALDMLTHIYNETGNYSKAEEAISKMSADSYNARIVGMVSMLGLKRCHTEQDQFAKESLWKLYWTMNHVFACITHSYMVNKEYEKAIAFYEAYEKHLSVFDNGCSDFYATDKIFACENKANVYMKMGEKEKCLAELKRFFILADQVRSVARSSDFHIAIRNPIYFSNISEEILEEYMAEIQPEGVLGKYDAFFGEEEAYIRFKESVVK